MKLTRRSALKSISALAASAPFASVGATVPTKPIRFCVFADMHYNPGGWANDDVAFLDKILRRAEDEKCSLLFQLGDLVHAVGSKRLGDYVRRFNASKVPSFNVLGNHDCDYSPRHETCAAYKLDTGYYRLDREGWRFVVCDPNYMLVNGAYVPYEHDNIMKKPKDAPFNVIPPEQLEWIRESVFGSPFPCVIVSHQSFERPMWSSGVANGDKVRAIIREANRRFPGRVRLVMCGHYHVNHVSVIDNVPYWEVNGANFFSNGFRHKAYPADYVKTHVVSDRTLAHKDPLSAVVTLYPEGRIRIEGSKSEWLFGISPEKAGVKLFDDFGRCASDEIEDADFTFFRRG